MKPNPPTEACRVSHVLMGSLKGCYSQDSSWKKEKKTFARCESSFIHSMLFDLSLGEEKLNPLPTHTHTTLTNHLS